MAAQTAEQQAIIALRQELDHTRAQVLQVAGQYDALARAHQALESNSTQLIQMQVDKVAAIEDKMKRHLFNQKMDLLDLKSIKPTVFAGKTTEAWKPWAKKFKLYVNGKLEGFRQALEWSEKHEGEIRDVNQMQWDDAAVADKKLHELLLGTIEGTAARIVEKPGLEGRGFEVWRLLKDRYQPSGGTFEIKCTNSLTSPERAKDMPSLADAIDRWEARMLKWEERMGQKFPEVMKIPALIQMVPTNMLNEIEWRFASDLKDYDRLVSALRGYAEHVRRSKINDDSRMDVDQVSYSMGVVAGLEYEGENEEPDMPEDKSIDQLSFRRGYQRGRDQRKGSGKGQGQRSGDKGKGKGDKGKGKGGGQDTAGGKGAAIDKSQAQCRYCKGWGHYLRECPKKDADMLKSRGRPAASVEEAPYAEEGEDDRVRPLRALGSMERLCASLEICGNCECEDPNIDAVDDIELSPDELFGYILESDDEEEEEETVEGIPMYEDEKEFELGVVGIGGDLGGSDF